MRILVSAETFGYGPVATCLNVVKELKKHDDVTVDFIGSGIALEQAKMSGYFDKYYICDVFDFESLKKFEKVFKSYNIFFSSENINGAIFGLRYIKNTYYIDNLMWMWDKVSKELEELKGYFISETMPCKKNFDRIGCGIKNPIFVGPVRDLNIEKCNIKKNQLVINIGGASSFLSDQAVINNFYNKIINDILSTPEISRFNSIIICGGSGAINSLHTDVKNVIIKTLANEEYLKVVNESSHCILSSGLGNFIETLNKDMNIMYLPAANYSQLLQLQYYKDMNLGFKMLNWDNFEFYEEIPEYLDEATGVKMVVNNIEKFNSKDYRDLINNLVKEFLNESQEQYFNHRNDFYNSYDRNGAHIVAETIYNENK